MVSVISMQPLENILLRFHQDPGYFYRRSSVGQGGRLRGGRFERMSAPSKFSSLDLRSEGRANGICRNTFLQSQLGRVMAELFMRGELVEFGRLMDRFEKAKVATDLQG